MKNLMRTGLMAILASGSALLQSCGDDPAPKIADVFVSGNTADGAVAYVKNGTLEIVGEAGADEEVEGSFVDGSDFYMAGRSGDDMAYWKNGVKTLIPLANPIMGWETMKQMIVKNSKQYILAYSPGHGGSVYYVDGVKHTIPTQAGIDDIAIASNGDVYVVGVNSSDHAAYWKNGVMKELSTVQSRATRIFISGTDVYIAGYANNGTGAWINMPVMWKNEVITELDETGNAYGIFVSGKDVYVTGNDADGLAVVWKNGTATPLEVTEAITAAEAYSIQVKNGDVYVLGYGYPAEAPVLWKNGVITTPFDGTQKGDFPGLSLK